MEHDPFELPFNSALSTVLHVDLNSCFASIEQQANPLLRGKAIVVAAYASQNGCILASSKEAKELGIKTGMRVKEGKEKCPRLIVLPADPPKYRNVHLKLRKLLSDYTNNLAPKSIDEFVLHLDGYPALRDLGMIGIGKEIKKRIKKEVGDSLTVSIGIGPNRFLAKTAAGLKKPDGLEEIHKDNYEAVFKSLKLTDLCGIANHNEYRLYKMGIMNVWDMYQSPVWKLKAAFHSVAGLYWYTRLHGFEIDAVSFARRSYGNSYSIPKPFSEERDLAPILMKLVEKMSFRLRRAGYKARGVHLAIRFRGLPAQAGGAFWHRGVSFGRVLFSAQDIYKEAHKLLCEGIEACPSTRLCVRSLLGERSGVANLAVSAFGLTEARETQLSLFEDVVKKETVAKTCDELNDRWGDFVVTSARMAETGGYVPDRIAFGNVKEVEDLLAQAGIANSENFSLPH